MLTYNSMEFDVEKEDQEDTPKIIEQKIFTQGVFGYCSHFNIQNKNSYNINFPHFQDYSSTFHKEKYINQSLHSVLTNKKREVDFPLEFARALEDVLIAKNNYQRIILQMLDTIYHQEQRIKHQSLLLQLHNAYTSRTEEQISRLKHIIAYMATQNNSSESSSPRSRSFHVSQRLSQCLQKADSVYREESSRRSLDNLEKAHFFGLFSVNSNHSGHDRDNNSSSRKIDFSPNQSLTSRQKPKSVVVCLSQRRKSTNEILNENKRCLNLQPKAVKVNKKSTLNRTSDFIPQKENKTTEKRYHLVRRNSEIVSSIGKEKCLTEREKRLELKAQQGVKELYNKALKRQRNMSCEALKKNVREKEKENICNTSRDVSDTEPFDIGEKVNRLLRIPCIQEDTIDNEYDSLRFSRSNNTQNSRNIELTGDSSFSHSHEEHYRMPWKDSRQEKEEGELGARVQNKSMSFQSSSGNVIQDTEVTESSRKEERVLREVVNCQQVPRSFWPKETENCENDIKYFCKGKSYMENCADFVTSPSFGVQTTFTDRSFNRVGENQAKGKVEGNKKKGVNEMTIRQVYGGVNPLRKNKWEPLLSKKN